jgi:hypothetical protein
MECVGDAAGFAAFLLGEDMGAPRLFQSGSNSTCGPGVRPGAKTTFHADPGADQERPRVQPHQAGAVIGDAVLPHRHELPRDLNSPRDLARGLAIVRKCGAPAR